MEGFGGVLGGCWVCTTTRYAPPREPRYAPPPLGPGMHHPPAPGMHHPPAQVCTTPGPGMHHPEITGWRRDISHLMVANLSVQQEQLLGSKQGGEVHPARAHRTPPTCKTRGTRGVVVSHHLYHPHPSLPRHNGLEQIVCSHVHRYPPYPCISISYLHTWI